MNMRIVVLILAVALFAATGAWADTVTYSSANTITNQLTNWTTGSNIYLEIPQWDSTAFSGYYLAGISITLSDGLTSTMTVTNTGTTSTTVAGDSGVSGHFKLYDPSDTLLSNLALSATIGTDTVIGAWDGSQDANDSQTWPLTGTGTPVVWNTSAPTYLTLFTGTGNVNLPTAGTGSFVLDTSGGNPQGSGPVYLSGGGSVTYTYDPTGPSTPEPGSLGLGAMCLLGLVGFRRRRKR
jgi:MYXO-CTERM domain-containing protein